MKREFLFWQVSAVIFAVLGHKKGGTCFVGAAFELSVVKKRF